MIHASDTVTFHYSLSLRAVRHIAWDKVFKLLFLSLPQLGGAASSNANKSVVSGDIGMIDVRRKVYSKSLLT